MKPKLWTHLIIWRFESNGSPLNNSSILFFFKKTSPKAITAVPQITVTEKCLQIYYITVHYYSCQTTQRWPQLKAQLNQIHNYLLGLNLSKISLGFLILPMSQGNPRIHHKTQTWGVSPAALHIYKGRRSPNANSEDVERLQDLMAPSWLCFGEADCSAAPTAWSSSRFARELCFRKPPPPPPSTISTLTWPMFKSGLLPTKRRPGRFTVRVDLLLGFILTSNGVASEQPRSSCVL